MTSIPVEDTSSGNSQETPPGVFVSSRRNMSSDKSLQNREEEKNYFLERYYDFPVSCAHVMCVTKSFPVISVRAPSKIRPNVDRYASESNTIENISSFCKHRLAVDDMTLYPGLKREKMQNVDFISFYYIRLWNADNLLESDWSNTFFFSFHFILLLLSRFFLLLGEGCLLP